MKFYKLIIALLFLSSYGGFAQNNQFRVQAHSQNNLATQQSLNYRSKQKSNTLSVVTQDSAVSPTKKWYSTDTGKSLIASGGLIGLGLYTYKDSGFLNRVSVKENINRYLPDFENHLDDLTQWIPYAGVFALDAAGVKSKYKLKRKVTTMGTSLLLNLLVVQSLKYSIKETRPDGSANNSFPSGHTTTAFMGAHIFHKEYGDRSVYYSVGAYTLAAVTGIFRQLNDRHWSSDVLVGAGLGISLTELAYYFNDLYYKDDGINVIDYNNRISNHSKPSFLGIKAGVAQLTDGGVNQPQLGFSAQTGFNADIEGAYFFNKYIGFGGNIGIQSFPISINDAVQSEFRNEGYDIAFEPIGSSKYSVGPFIQYTFGKSTVGTKFLLGRASISDTKVRLTPLIDDDITETDDLIFANLFPDASFTWTSGIYIKRLLSDKLQIGLYADYNAADLNLDFTYIESITDNGPVYTSGRFGDTFNSFVFGGNIEVMLW